MSKQDYATTQQVAAEQNGSTVTMVDGVQKTWKDHALTGLKVAGLIACGAAAGYYAARMNAGKSSSMAANTAS